PQPHRRHRFGHPARLVGVELGRPPGVDLAEVAPPGTLIAADEEGGLPVLPALVDVGTAGLLADRVQTLPLYQPAQRGELRPHPRHGNEAAQPSGEGVVAPRGTLLARTSEGD